MKRVVHIGMAWLLTSGALFSHAGSPSDLTEHQLGVVLEVPLYAAPAPDIPTMLPGSAASIEAKAAGIPTLTVYAPAQQLATGAAVIVCPGGGYEHLALGSEGHDVAQYLVKQGITAAVLRYRLPNGHWQADPSVAPLLDAQQAIRLMRRNASLWNLRPNRVGMLGFSAGGHLSATAGTRWTSPRAEDMGPESLRPDFLVLIYPLISMQDGLVHLNSRLQLLGPYATADQLQLFSADQQVTAASPPAFLVHAADDIYVPVGNSRAYYQACIDHGVSAELHVYAAGNHNFGLYNPTTTDQWPDRLLVWMRGQGLLTP
jgi:acetyl esterase/lipase